MGYIQLRLPKRIKNKIENSKRNREAQANHEEWLQTQGLDNYTLKQKAKKFKGYDLPKYEADPNQPKYILYSKNRTLKFWKNFPKISLNEHKQGLNLWRKKCNYIVFKNPEKICPEINSIKNFPKVKKITDFYFDNLKYKHVHSKVIYTFKNKKFPIDVQVFHNDLDGLKVLKLFIYLNKVKNKSDGPTEFIKKSNIFSEENKSKLKNWKTRLLNKKQDLKFKNNGIFSFIGNVGDGFYLNTGVYHRGAMPRNSDRILLILTFSCHEELITKKVK